MIALVAALRVSRHVLRPESAPEADIAALSRPLRISIEIVDKEVSGEASSRLGCER